MDVTRLKGTSVPLSASKREARHASTAMLPKATPRDVEDEEAKQSIVESVDLILNLALPAKIGNVEFKGTKCELPIEDTGEVQTDCSTYVNTKPWTFICNGDPGA